MSDDRLFAVEDLAPLKQLSAGRKLTIRNNQKLADGTHPATGRPLLVLWDKTLDVPTCGDCQHLIVRGEEHRRFFKCGKVQMTFGPATDIRKSWRACDLFAHE